MPLSHEKQPLLLKVYEEKPPRRFTIKTFPPPEPLSERQIEPIPPISLPPCSTSPKTPPYPPPRNSPIKGEIKFGGGVGWGCQTGRRGNNYKHTCIWRI